MQATCEAILRQLDDYIDRELTPGDMHLVERHIEDCLRCADRYRFEISLVQEIRSRLRRIRLPGHLVASIRLRLDAERAGSPRPPRGWNRLRTGGVVTGSKPHIQRIGTRAVVSRREAPAWPERKPGVSRRTRVANGTGSGGVRIWPSASGARFGRTTRRTATCWEYFSARPGAQPRLPLGRGWPARHHRPPGPSLLRAGAVERARSDPQGAALRPDRPRGQPRRGREGGLLLPRFHADPFLHQGALQVPAGRISLRAAGPGQPRARQVGARVRADRHRRVRRPALLRRLRRVRQGRCRRHPDPRHRGQPRPRGRDGAPPADALVPEHLELGPRRGGLLAQAEHPPERTGQHGRPSTAISGGYTLEAEAPEAAPPPSSSSPRTRPTSSRLFGVTQSRSRT